jgi:anthranilate phosphoribosyltransferase
VLANEAGPARDIVALNAGVALYAANVASTMADGVKLALKALATGRAAAKMEAFVKNAKGLAPK